MTTSMSKIEPRHLRLQAVVYIRQSTPQQIQNNQESTRRQYDLACRARQMGWPETAVPTPRLGVPPPKPKAPPADAAVETKPQGEPGAAE